MELRGEMHGYIQSCGLKKHSKGVVLENLHLMLKKK